MDMEVEKEVVEVLTMDINTTLELEKVINRK